jgi:hypothetical protein
MAEITDTQRLDWIEKNSYGLRCRRKGVHNLIVWNQFDLRAVIDCAMKHGVVLQRGNRQEIMYRQGTRCPLVPGKYAPWPAK